LFVVAHGLTVTGAIDWYIGKLLGTPKSAAGAQLRLMIPVTIVSAFLNNTPIVAVMIPIVLRWARTIRVSASQLLIPLSYAAILGGTCTLIGTSTNLVIQGLLLDNYGIKIFLFDVAPYGVPVAIIGVAYTITFGPFLLPGGRSEGAGSPFDGDEILLGARITPWSPAAGRSVKRSGLRDTGGLYLVSVRRAATGNIHRAVGQEFVLNVGDVVYFSGLIEGFGDFCHEHGLEIVTNESSLDANLATTEPISTANVESTMNEPLFDEKLTTEAKSNTDDDEHMALILDDVHGANSGKVRRSPKESLALSDEATRLRSINLMSGTYQLGACCHTSSPKLMRFMCYLISDIIQGIEPIESIMSRSDKSAQVVVTTNSSDSRRLVLIGVNAPDRPGLLLDISKGLLRLNLQLHHTEAAVVGERSVSVWRCTHLEDKEADMEEIRAVLSVRVS
jgi:predicted amino acid-binding ACT domain protein